MTHTSPPARTLHQTTTSKISRGPFRGAEHWPKCVLCGLLTDVALDAEDARAAEKRHVQNVALGRVVGDE